MTPRARHRFSLLGVLCATVLTATGCASQVPFTHELRTQHDLSQDDLEHLQFYVSHDITLRRELRTKERTIDDGRLRLHAGKQVEEVVIEEGTPGVAVAVGPSAIVVSFDDDSNLVFSVRDASLPVDEPLQLLPSSRFAEAPEPFPGASPPPTRTSEPLADLVGRYFLRDTSRVEFQGAIWETVGSSGQAHLLIDAETLEEVDERRTTLGGREL